MKRKVSPAVQPKPQPAAPKRPPMHMTLFAKIGDAEYTKFVRKLRKDRHNISSGIRALIEAYVAGEVTI